MLGWSWLVMVGLFSCHPVALRQENPFDTSKLWRSSHVSDTFSKFDGMPSGYFT
jgi:hypothetical protein